MSLKKEVGEMKNPKYQNTIFEEEGEAIVRQQVIDSYYEGTTDTKKRQDVENQENQ